MIDLLTALKIAEENFPAGPEAVAKAIGVRLEYSPLKGCEGWCIRNENALVIRINSTSPKVRQRFTLAHELSHVLMDSTPDVWALPDRPPSQEEELINQLAAEMLLPARELHKQVSEVPVSSAALGAIAKAANVSEMMAARRVVALRQQLGIDNAFLADFTGSRLRWIFPKDAVTEAKATEIYSRIPRDKAVYAYEVGKNSVAAFLIETPWSTSMLVQSIMQPAAPAESREAMAAG